MELKNNSHLYNFNKIIGKTKLFFKLKSHFTTNFKSIAFNKNKNNNSSKLFKNLLQ